MTGYEELRRILAEAYDQSAKGKGRARHANARPWTEQPILSITRTVSAGFPYGQALKKVGESYGMLDRGEYQAAKAELLGAIVYIAAAIYHIEEQFITAREKSNDDSDSL